MNLHLDITPTGLALALVIAMLVTLIYLVHRTDKTINHALANTDVLITTLDVLVADLRDTGARTLAAIESSTTSAAAIDNLTTARLAQLVEIGTATNEGVRVLCEMPKRVNDPTVKARLREEVRNIQESELAGLPPDAKVHMLRDLAEEMEADTA